jgi:histidine triad (HIT) family protein
MCVFCKIIAGEIPNYTVYEDDAVLAFLDIHPCSKGHTVIIPKKHVASLMEMDNDLWQRTMHGVQQALQKVYTVLKPDGVNIGINDGEASGQTVPHVHWHIFPRYKNDGGGSIHSIIRSREPIDVGEVAKLFT